MKKNEKKNERKGKRKEAKRNRREDTMGFKTQSRVEKEGRKKNDAEKKKK